jgi:VWFA-related protein
MKPAAIRAAAIRVCAVLLCLAACGPTAFAQAQPPGPAPAQEPSGGFSISVSVPVVNVDVVITDNNGNYMSGLKRENFRISEDGVPQTISNFDAGTGPFTIVLLAEYSKMGYGYFLYNARSWGASFLNQLKPQDWIALASFDTRPHIEVDFTHDPKEVMQGLMGMSLPFFSESNVFDAIVDTLDRMREIKGRKAILLLASGIDTFSRINLNDVLGRLRNENDISIFCVGVAEPYFVRSASGPDLTYLQAQNQLRTFASLTGGRAWFPRFDQEVPGIMADVAASLRNQYSIAYTPSNTATDGKYRKIKVELLDHDGSPLIVKDAKGKKIDIHIYARQGYTAPKGSVN